MQNMMFSSRQEMREAAAELYGIVIAVAFDATTFKQSVEELIKNVNEKVCSIFALGYAIKLYLK